jgi:hypothetical protein
MKARLDGVQYHEYAFDIDILDFENENEAKCVTICL